MPKKIIVAHPEGHEKAGQPTGVIQFKFEDGTEQSVDITSLDDAIRFRLAVHGASQKIGDSYAGAKAESNPVAFAIQSVRETIDQLVKGLWRTTSVGGPRVTDLATVFAQINGVTIDEAVEFIDGLDETQVKELRAQKKVKAMLAAITAKRAAEKAAKLLEEADAEAAAA